MQRLIAVVYRHVIDDVVSKVKPEFVQEGVDEEVLDELRVLWESKLSSIIDAEYPEEATGNESQSKATPDKQKVKAEQKVPESDHAPPTSSQQPETAVPDTAEEEPRSLAVAGNVNTNDVGQVLVDPAQAAVAFLHSQGSLDLPDASQSQPLGVVTGQPVDQQWYQQMSNHHTQQPSLDSAAMGGLLSNLQGYLANSPGLPYSFSGIASPALSGLGSLLGNDSFNIGLSGQVSFGMPSVTEPDNRKRKLEDTGTTGGQPEKAVVMENGQGIFKLPQQDGPADGEPDAEDEDNLSNLSSDDEDDDEDDEIPDIVLATFERVGRTKNRWKATLKDGIAHISGRDYLFHKGLGEMEF